MSSRTRNQAKMGSVAEERTSIEGQSETLPCRISNATVNEGGAEYVLEWHRQEQGLIYSAHNQDATGTMAVDYQGRLKHSGLALVFSPLRVTDAGVYWCVVKPLRGLAGSVPTGRKVQLYVHAAPTFNKVSQSDVYKRFGENVRLECFAKGVPEPEILWKKDGSPLRPRTGLVFGHAHLTINELQATDDGLYVCEASNEAGARSHVIRLHVTGGIRFIETPRNLTAIEGTDVRFSCLADSPPNKISYHWFYGEKELHAAGTLALRSRIEGGGLKVQRISKDDAGWYTCQASDDVGSSSTSRTYLDVQYKPRVKPSTPVIQYVPLGLTGRIKCDVDASPTYNTVKWQKDGVKIGYLTEKSNRMRRNKWKDSRYIGEERGAILKISEVTAADSGEYTCQPSNPLGDGLPFEIRVFVTRPPIFDSTPSSRSERVAGQAWSVECSARVAAGSEDQKLEIFWRRKDGTRVPSAKNGRLIVHSVTEFDHGCYDCVARTNAIELTKESCLRVVGIAPRAPEHLAVSTGAYDASLRWAAGYDGGEGQYFLAKYRPLPSSHWLTVNASNAVQLTLTNLLPSTDYEFFVEPRNRLGPGVPSPAVLARTKGDDHEDLFVVPTARPGVTYFPDLAQSMGPRPPAPKLTFTSEYPSLILSWQQPHAASPTSTKPVPVFYYSLEYRQAQHQSEEPGHGHHKRPPETHSGKFKLLAQRVFDRQYRVLVNRPPFMAGKTFDVRVKAHSVASFSEPSNLVSFTVPGVPSQTALISGIAGGVAFLFLCLVLAMLAIRCAKRRHCHRSTRPVKNHNHGHKNNSSLILANGKHQADSVTDDTGGMAEWSLHGGTGARQVRSFASSKPSRASPSGHRRPPSVTDDDAGYRTGAGELTDLSCPTNPLLAHAKPSDNDRASSVVIATKTSSRTDRSPQMPELTEADLMMFPHSRESQV